jgi:hypothetical protein
LQNPAVKVWLQGSKAVKLGNMVKIGVAVGGLHVCAPLARAVETAAEYRGQAGLSVAFVASNGHRAE